MARSAELRERSNEDLKDLADGLRAEIFNARFQRHTEQLEKTSELTNKKRDLARVLTIIRQRELEAKDNV